MLKYRFLPSSGSRVVSFLVFSCCFLGYLHSSVPHCQCPDSHLIWQDSFTEDAIIQSVTVPIMCIFYFIFLENVGSLSFSLYHMFSVLSGFLSWEVSRKCCSCVMQVKESVLCKLLCRFILRKKEQQHLSVVFTFVMSHFFFSCLMCLQFFEAILNQSYET